METKIRRWLASGVLLLGGVALATSLGPAIGNAPLEAQVTCKTECEGNLCTADCQEECTDGSCCSWRFYYVCRPGGQT